MPAAPSLPGVRPVSDLTGHPQPNGAIVEPNTTDTSTTWVKTGDVQLRFYRPGETIVGSSVRVVDEGTVEIAAGAAAIFAAGGHDDLVQFFAVGLRRALRHAGADEVAQAVALLLDGTLKFDGVTDLDDGELTQLHNKVDTERTSRFERKLFRILAPVVNDIMANEVEDGDDIKAHAVELEAAYFEDGFYLVVADARVHFGDDGECMDLDLDDELAEEFNAILGDAYGRVASDQRLLINMHTGECIEFDNPNFVAPQVAEWAARAEA